MKNLFPLILVIGLSMMSSCTKVIDINLNKSNPQYIVEAELNNADTIQVVHITRSVNFSEVNNYPSVNNAIVVIESGPGNSDTLAQSEPGYYTTTKTKGIPGQTYTLVIFVDGRQFTATSTMPRPVSIDSLQTVVQPSFGQQIKVPKVTFHETAGVGDYYHYVVYRNHHRIKSLYIDNDLANDGAIMNRSLLDPDSTYQPGEHVEIELQSISKEVYDYYFSLQQTIGQSSATPANPISEIKGDNVHGYFSAHTADRRELIVN